MMNRIEDVVREEQQGLKVQTKGPGKEGDVEVITEVPAKVTEVDSALASAIHLVEDCRNQQEKVNNHES